MSAPDNADLTPDSAAPTDIAPLGRTAPKPGHEMTADEERSGVDWDAIAGDSDFKALVAAKKSFVLPTTIFFLVYYFALLILVGWYPEITKKKIGSVNVAYLFALSQFFMTWIIAGLYVAKAAGWDKTAAALISKFKN